LATFVDYLRIKPDLRGSILSIFFPLLGKVVVLQSDLMKRLISALLIILFFLIIGYVLLMYATGKRLGDNGKLVGIGIIQIDTTPDNSKVYINNKFNKDGDTSIENLKPGTYTIKVTKENYHPWQKEVEIVPFKPLSDCCYI
jgi:hypothetical protein